MRGFSLSFFWAAPRSCVDPLGSRSPRGFGHVSLQFYNSCSLSNSVPLSVHSPLHQTSVVKHLNSQVPILLLDKKKSPFFILLIRTDLRARLCRNRHKYKEVFNLLVCYPNGYNARTRSEARSMFRGFSVSSKSQGLGKAPLLSYVH